jgi:hypothetical protein
VTGSTSEPRLRFVVELAIGALVVAGLTALVVLIRAGGDPGDAATWPITWELRSSDNGTLYQLFTDVVAGRPLDWSFSPQVYVFPELPVSGLAFLLTGGDLYLYYLVVAVLNQVLFFLVLAALARVLWPTGSAVLRAGVALTPLLLLPLVGTTWVFSFHLAPTYYVGMYLALLAAPLLLLVRTWATRILVGLALALTIASNPLTVVFAAPGLLAVLVVRLRRRGPSGLGGPLVVVAAVVVAATVARVVFTPLQGTGLLTYVDLDVFRSRVDALGPYWAYQLLDPAARVLLPLGALTALACLIAAARASWMLARRIELVDESRAFATVFFGVVPLGGLAATFVALITHYYYFWPVLVLPFVLMLFALPASTLSRAAAAATLATLAIGFVTGGVANLAGSHYFGYRTAETRCLDAVVPGQVGYATFSDARRVGLPSATGIRLVPVTAELEPNLWLTNRAYVRDEHPTFLYVNERGDERALDGDVIRARYGDPVAIASCGAGMRVLIYDSALR